MSGESILVVDDNETNLKLACVLLKAAGYDVRGVEDGELALALLMEWHPTLVLTDLQMPRMDGFEFTRQVKANEATRDIIVVALSAHASEEDRLLALACGCADCFIKPLDIRKLAEVAAQALDSPTTRICVRRRDSG